MNIEIGMGATLAVGSDSYAYTIIDVNDSGKRILLQRDKVTMVSGDGYSKQEYKYDQDTFGEKIVASLRKDGRWKIQKTNISVYPGHRRQYIDPSF